MKRILSLSALALAMIAGACATKGPEPIAYGVEACARCRMAISEPRFGAELITTTGRVLKFDSIECLGAESLALGPSRTVHSVWVTNYRKPGEFVRADSAVYLRDARVRSPMGAGLLAFPSNVDTVALVAQLGGRVLRWSDVLELSREHASNEAVQ
jgi:copper chaperone NosL